MKKFLFIFLLISVSLNGFSQETQYKTITNIPYYDNVKQNSDVYLKERCVLDIYYPVNKKDFATIVWFHGGGLTGGAKELPDGFKNKNICIIGVNYRLSPMVQAPAYIEDAAAAVAWAFKNIEKYGGDASKIFLSGHSAGGYLTCMIGLDKKYLAAHDIDVNRIAGLIPLSAQTITHFNIREQRGIKNTQPVVDEYAPLFHVRLDAPPILLITGDRELELLGRYEENAYFARMMKIAGHQETRLLELDGYDHGMTYPAFPLVLKEVEKILNNQNKK
ncbi:MAG: Carboxylesterase NlhH [Bacteroidetes bacterium ADurb.BinA174]|nr:MAG: Carboxylesterase NlhH [Bacteroidetes bacterium ADurb.BinA174]